MGRFVKRGLHTDHVSPRLGGAGTAGLTWQAWNLRLSELRALGCFVVPENLPACWAALGNSWCARLGEGWQV